MYRVKLLNLNRKELFETITFRYPDDSTLKHIMGQVKGDCFVDIARLRESECDGLEVEFDQKVGVQIGKWK